MEQMGQGCLADSTRQHETSLAIPVACLAEHARQGPAKLACGGSSCGGNYKTNPARVHYRL